MDSPSSLLAALNCRDNVHLVIGTNPLAATRCGQSLSAGAHPILIAPKGAELHYALQKQVDEGLVKWHKRSFEDADLVSLGRQEVDGVVDAVFVTFGSRDPLSKFVLAISSHDVQANLQAFTLLHYAVETVSPSTLSMLLNSAPFPSCRHIPTALYRLASPPTAAAASWLLASAVTLLLHYLRISALLALVSATFDAVSMPKIALPCRTIPPRPTTHTIKTHASTVSLPRRMQRTAAHAG